MDAPIFEWNAQIELEHWWFVARRRIISDLVHRLLPAGSDAQIVDVGCGTGGNLSGFTQGYRCTGIDPSADAIRLARKRFPDATFIEGFAPQDLGEVSGSADLWMLNDVLEHVEDDFEVFSSLLSASRPGALFVVTVPADPSLWSPHDEVHGHYRRYTLERFRRVWSGLPVSELMLTHFNSRLYPVVKLLRTLNRWSRRSSGEHGTDLRMPSGFVNRTLTRVFAGERGRLGPLLDGGGGRGYGRGVSLLAVLRREEGEVVVRGRPADCVDQRGD